VTKQDALLARIVELLKLHSGDDGDAPMRSYQLYMGTVTVVAQLYGPASAQMTALKDEKNRLMAITANEYQKHGIFIKELHGLLKTVVAEVKAGLVYSIESEARGEVYSDFVALAKLALEGGSKDVAAVLASAALEDALKRFAESKGLDVGDKDMSEVISQLKSGEHLQKPEAKVVQSYVTLRNKALHAEWESINSPEVASLMGFVENFILTRFGGTASPMPP
jgi:hypothetical protein